MSAETDTHLRSPPAPPLSFASFSWSFLLLLTISVALRSDADSHSKLAETLQSHPWLECLAPLWVLDLLYAGVAGYVAANTIAGRFVVTPTQGLCFALLVAALAASTLAEMLLTGDHRCALGFATSMQIAARFSGALFGEVGLYGNACDLSTGAQQKVLG